MSAKTFCLAMLLLSSMTLVGRGKDETPQDKAAAFDVFDRSGEEAVLAAVAKGDLAEIKRLEAVLNSRTIPNLGIHAWNSPNTDVAIFLRDKGKIAASDLQIAAFRGDAVAVRELLQEFQKWEYAPGTDGARHAQRNGPEFGNLGITSDTALRLAIRRGHTAVVRELLAGGANANDRVLLVRPHHATNEYPLSEAIQLGNAAIVQLLVEAGAILQESPTRYSPKDGRVSLHKFYGEHAKSPPDVVEKKLKEMFDAGLLVRERDPYANIMCPLALAISTGRAKIVAILLKAGADPNLPIPGEELRPGVNPSAVTTYDRRPLHVAAIKGNPEIVRILIENGADVNARTSDGRTPLSLAIGFSQGDVADLLRAAGAK